MLWSRSYVPHLPDHRCLHIRRARAYSSARLAGYDHSNKLIVRMVDFVYGRSAAAVVCIVFTISTLSPFHRTRRVASRRVDARQRSRKSNKFDFDAKQRDETRVNGALVGNINDDDDDDDDDEMLSIS